MTKKIDDKIAEIERKQAEHAALIHSLKASLAIQELWPEVYDTGESCKLRLVGDWTRPAAMQGVIVRSDGEQRSFPLPDLPAIVRDDLIGQQKDQGGGLPVKTRLQEWAREQDRKAKRIAKK